MHRTPRSRWLGCALWIGTATVASWCIAGCATTGSAIPQPANDSTANLRWPEDSAAYASLVALREAEQPATNPLEVPMIRGLDTESLAPFGAEDARAERGYLPLAGALAIVRNTRPDQTGQPPPTPTGGTLVRAQRLYVSGLAKLTAGDNVAAARDLAGAAQLDPSAPRPWLRLAEAQSRLGQASASLMSRKKAVDLGLNDAISLAIVGMQAARTGQHQLAAFYLSGCLAASPERIDPLLRQVALVRIADPLRQLGYLAASIGALQEGLVLPRQLTAPTRFGNEATDIARRASDLWLQIGDTACRLGDDRLAAEAYANAAVTPSIDPASILARRAYVLLRSGRHASVGLLVLDSIAQREGRADAKDLGVLALIREHQTVGSLVAIAIADLKESLPPTRTASTETSLILARAAVASKAHAANLLADRATAVPGERRVIDALVGIQNGDTGRERVALRLVRDAPIDAEAIADSLVAWHERPAAILERLPNSPEGRLLGLHVLRIFGRPAEAAAIQPAARDAIDHRLTISLAEARGLAAAESGSWDTVDQVLGELAGESLAIARVCRAAQRYEHALAALTTELGADATMPILLLASELALGTGEFERAEAMLERAVALDPYNELAYEGLVNVHQATGNRQATTDTIRELRTRVPSSQLLRWVNAQEEARRGLLDPAERSLRDLVEDQPLNARALGMLLQIWSQRSSVNDTDSLEEAVRWLTSRAEARPTSPNVNAARGRVLGLLTRDDDAERALRDALESRPSPAVSRALEDLLARTDRADEAVAIASSRLAASGEGIDASLEHAEVLARAGRWAEVAPRVRAALPDRSMLTEPQRGRVLSLVSALASRAEQPETPTARSDAIALFTLAQLRGIDLPWQLRYSLWALLSTAPDATDEQITNATDSFLTVIDSLELAGTIIGDNATQLLIPIETLDHARGQVAYQLASMLHSAQKETAAIWVYRAALRLYPDHAWAANNLGYFLLERNESLDEAEALLERAYALKPDQSSIADSLGWLRYKFGHPADKTLADGSVRPGAISLLITASGLPGGGQNTAIHDHLGDALWRAGETARAEAVWIRAQQLLVGELVGLRDGGSSPRRAQLVESQTRVGGKLDAIRGGREPSIAPLIER